MVFFVLFAFNIIAKINLNLDWNLLVITEFMFHATRFIMRVVQGYSRDAWFYFSWNVNLVKLFFVTRDLKVLRDREEELLTDIRDFTTQFYVILGRKFSELLE